MQYLTFDSNIWIYLLDDAWKDYNPLDHLEHWIEENQVQILLPEVILTEWERNKGAEKENRRKKLREFFTMARDIVPSVFINTFNTPDNINQIIDDQFKRIDVMIRDKASIIKETSELKIFVYEWGLKKKAPMHKKSSIADAIIIFSLFDFAQQNPEHEYMFISNNHEDYCKKDSGKTEPHPDLKDYFHTSKVQYYSNLYHALNILKDKIPVTIDFEARKTDRLKSKITNKAFNPAITTGIKNIKESYLDNIKMLDIVIANNYPTSSQVTLALGLMEEADSYKKYFLKNIRSPFWFDLLKEKGIFDPKNNPSPVPVDKGYSIPLWDAIPYLLKLGTHLEKENNTALASKLLSLISDVSSRPVDNYTTWFNFIKILGYIPNDLIEVKIFDLVPIWLEGQFGNTLQTMEIGRSLINKFLMGKPSSLDIEKTNRLLANLLTLKRNPEADGKANRLTSIADSHYLKEFLTKKEILEKLAIYCHKESILHLGRLIKYLLFDYPHGIGAEFQAKGIEYSFLARFEESNLSFKLFGAGYTNIIDELTLSDYENLSKRNIIQQARTFIKNHANGYIRGRDFDDPLNRLEFVLGHDQSFSIGSSSIHKLGDRYREGETLEVYGLIFRDWLDEIANQDSSEVIDILNIICHDPKYKAPFFFRISLYIIEKHWKPLKGFFWKILGQKDENRLFSNSSFKKELFSLLTSIEKELEDIEIARLEEIIALGDQSREKNKENGEYWKLRWISALKNTKPFSEDYERLSTKLNKSNTDFEREGEVTISGRSGAKFSSEKLNEMKNGEIADFITSFNPKRGYGELSIDSVASALGKGFEENPEKFVEDLEVFLGVPFIYAYHIFLGLRDALKAGRSLNWTAVLNYALNYIDDPRYGGDELKAENDGWRADNNWVSGAISDLISEGMIKNDENLKVDNLNIAKTILKNLSSRLSPIDDFEERGMNHVMYTLNSTAGKVLRSLLDYSLNRVRNYFPEKITGRWEEDVKHLYESTLEKGINDGFILLGMYFPQFCYLDMDWTIGQVENLKSSNDKSWSAFMGGLAFNAAPDSLKMYDLFKDHYRRAIKENKYFGNGHDQGLIKHLVSFYFWFYEDLNSNDLLKEFIDNAAPVNITDMITFIWQQDKFEPSLEEEDKIKFKKIIYELWEYILLKYKSPNNEEEEKTLNSLVHLLIFVETLDDRTTDNIIQSSKYIVKHSHAHEFIENLLDIVKKNNSKEFTSNLSKILSNIPYREYLSDFEYQPIISLTRYLYENGTKEAANDFCNLLSEKGHDFLKPIFGEFNN